MVDTWINRWAGRPQAVAVLCYAEPDKASTNKHTCSSDTQSQRRQKLRPQRLNQALVREEEEDTLSNVSLAALEHAIARLAQTHSERICVGIGLNCILTQVGDTVNLLLHSLLDSLLDVWHGGSLILVVDEREMEDGMESSYVVCTGALSNSIACVPRPYVILTTRRPYICHVLLYVCWTFTIGR